MLFIKKRIYLLPSICRMHPSLVLLLIQVSNEFCQEIVSFFLLLFFYSHIEFNHLEVTSWLSHTDQLLNRQWPFLDF